MHFLFPALTVLFLLGSAASDIAAQDKKAPDKLTFAAKPGTVTFDHAQHVKAAKNDCKTCHDKLFAQDQTAPLNYKAAVHKTAEAKQTSCAACHHAGGASFESKGHCSRCHSKGGAKSGV